MVNVTLSEAGFLEELMSNLSIPSISEIIASSLFEDISLEEAKEKFKKQILYILNAEKLSFKHIARATSGKKIAYELSIENITKHFIVDGVELKRLSGAKRITDSKVIFKWLQSQEGRKWLVNNPYSMEEFNNVK